MLSIVNSEHIFAEVKRQSDLKTAVLSDYVKFCVIKRVAQFQVYLGLFEMLMEGDIMLWLRGLSQY